MNNKPLPENAHWCGCKDNKEICNKECTVAVQNKKTPTFVEQILSKELVSLRNEETDLPEAIFMLTIKLDKAKERQQKVKDAIDQIREMCPNIYDPLKPNKPSKILEDEV